MNEKSKQEENKTVSHWFCTTGHKENLGIVPEYQITERNEDQNFRIYKKNPVRS